MRRPNLDQRRIKTIDMHIFNLHSTKIYKHVRCHFAGQPKKSPVTDSPQKQKTYIFRFPRCGCMIGPKIGFRTVLVQGGIFWLLFTTSKHPTKKPSLGSRLSHHMNHEPPTKGVEKTGGLKKKMLTLTYIFFTYHMGIH